MNFLRIRFCGKSIISDHINLIVLAKSKTVILAKTEVMNGQAYLDCTGQRRTGAGSRFNQPLLGIDELQE
jgi:hypothetical protein